jgi:hypothetical protein
LGWRYIVWFSYTCHIKTCHCRREIGSKSWKLWGLNDICHLETSPVRIVPTTKVKTRHWKLTACWVLQEKAMCHLKTCQSVGYYSKYLIWWICISGLNVFPI